MVAGSYSLRALLASMVLASFQVVVSECPNACSGHGSCGLYDACMCYRNWFRNDCSERVCQFDLAMVDLPKGDLNKDGVVSGPGVNVVENDMIHRLGTTEQYPSFVTGLGDVIPDMGHALAECSNKGVCDRQLGVCACMVGYEGSSCNRVSCPVNEDTGLMCNGNGVCNNAAEIALDASGNQYWMWDRLSSMGCVCDPGYHGAVCENRKCKVGYDPLYFNDFSSRRYSNWTLAIMTNDATANIVGSFYINFYNYEGRRIRTDAVPYNADCRTVVDALESLPRSAIPHGSVRCLKFGNFNETSVVTDGVLYGQYGVKYVLTFPENVGVLRQPSFSVNEGTQRDELSADRGSAKLTLAVYADGFTGENYDYFNELCMGVDVTIAHFEDDQGNAYQYLSSMTSIETRLLAQCLGDADGDVNRFDAVGKVLGTDYEWDYGSVQNPHLIRLVDQTSEPVTDLCPGSFNNERGVTNSTCVYSEPAEPDDERPKRPPGFFVPLVYDPVDKLFKIFTRPGDDYDAFTTFAVFATEGHAQVASMHSAVYTFPATPFGAVVYTRNSTADYPLYAGNVDCESNPTNTNGVLQCVEKGDTLFLMDPSLTLTAQRSNPRYLNLYVADKVGMESSAKGELWAHQITLNMGLNAAWPLEPKPERYMNNTLARVYVFSPPPLPHRGYRVVSECANRGNCDVESGQCECFPGYRGDSCSIVHNTQDQY